MNTYVKKPNRAIYWLAAKLVGFFYKAKYGITFTKEGISGLQPPFLLLSNHICNIDFLATALAVYPQKVNMVTAAMYFRNPFLRGILNMMGCIPKLQFATDTRAVRNILAVLHRGDAVAIFPAGQSSLSGEATYIDPSIAKLVKKMRVPVVAVKVQGGHIAFPKWNMKRLRRSRLDVSVKMLYTPEALAGMDERHIYDGIVDALYFDDYEWQRKAMIAEKRPRCAEGLQKFLFLCPWCHAELRMDSRGNRFFCEACGNAADMDEYGFLHGERKPLAFDTPTAWERWQTEYYMKNLSPDFRYEQPATLLRVMPNDKYVPVGKGRAILAVPEFRFTGECDGAPVDWGVPNGLAAIFPHEKKGCFDVYFSGGLYAIAPENARAVPKFVLLKECIYRKYTPSQ